MLASRRGGVNAETTAIRGRRAGAKSEEASGLEGED